MAKTRKLILALLLCTAMLLAFSATAFAETGITSKGSCGTDVKWTLYDSGKLLITGTGAMANYDGDSYVSPWTSYAGKIKTAEIGYGVTKIGSNAFLNCTAMTSVSIAETVSNIGSYAFSGCKGLTSLTIPASVLTIGEGAFKWCSGVKSVVIPESVTSLGASAFYGCSGMTSLTIPTSIKNIRESTFYYCNSLASLTIPKSVKTIGLDAFAYCSSIKSVAIPSSVTSIGSGAFAFCSALATVTIPTSVKSIGSFAFDSCSSLTKVVIPTSVTKIESFTFRDCSKLKTVTVPASVTSIGEFAFSGCASLTEIPLPSTVTSIAKYTFSGCTGLTSLTVPTGITSIAEYAFADCTGLKTVIFMGNAPTIKNGAFSGVTSNVYYFGSNSTWVPTVRLNYGGQLTWAAITTPKITSQSKDTAVGKGKTATLKVAATGELLKYQWYYQKPGETTWNKVKINGTSATYTLTAEMRHNGYKYKCFIKNLAGSALSKVINLSVVTAPKITTQPKSQTVALGSNATFKVVASGDLISYQWYYQKPGENTWNKVTINGDSATYTLTTAKRHDGYKYKCVVKNADSSVTSSVVTLTIVTTPKITAQPKSVTVKAGQKATFSVTATGISLKYQWYYQKPGTTKWIKVSINGTSATYTLTTAERHNGYKYRCVVTNAAGSVISKEVTLTVKK